MKIKQITNFLFAAKTLEDFHFLVECGAKRLVIGGKDFSRWGEFELHEIKYAINEAKKLSLSIELECDVLPTQMQMTNLKNSINELSLSTDDCIFRICDLGVMDWIYSKGFKFVPILEAGFHNLKAISIIRENYEDAITHYVLSKEIPFEVQKNYVKQHLFKNVEFSLVSPLQLLYTPRKLLENFSLKQTTSYRQTFASSEESVHKGFIVRENLWGTILFHPKHFSVMSRWESIENFDASDLLIDLRLIEDTSLRMQILQYCFKFLNGTISLQNCEELLQKELPYPLFRGFFDTNKTDVLFSKLKNPHNKHDKYQKIGDVLDMVKGKYLVVKINEGQQLKIKDRILIQSPLGKQSEVDLTILADISGRVIDVAFPNSIVCINYSKNFPSQSTIFKIHDSIDA